MALISGARVQGLPLVSFPEGPLVPLSTHHQPPGPQTSPQRRGRDSYSG
jgi:hypothetical protein